MLNIDVLWIDSINRPKSQPGANRTDIAGNRAGVSRMEGVYALIARLLYGTGMRLMKCA
jgi:hypothetical protein